MTAKTVTDESRSEHYVRNWALMFFIGTITNSTWAVVAASSKDLSEEFNAEKQFGMIGWASIGLTLILNVTAGWFESKKVKFTTRLWLNSSFMLVGQLIVAFAPTFTVLLVGILFCGLSSSFGDVAIMTYMHMFDATITGAFISGTGFAGIYGYFLYILAHSVGGIDSQSVFLFLLGPSCAYMVLWNLLKPYKQSDSGERERAGEHLDNISVGEGIMRYVRIFAKKHVWGVCVNLGMVFFFEFMIIGKFVRDSNNLSSSEGMSSGDKWAVCHSFEVLGLIYAVAIFVSRSTLPLWQRLPWMRYEYVTVFQFFQWVMWGLNSRLHFLPLEAQYPLMFTVGLCGGTSYVLIMYAVQNTYAVEEKEPTVVLICTMTTLFIIAVNVLTLILDNTILPPFDNSGCQ